MATLAVFLDLYQTIAQFYPPREGRLRQALGQLGLDAEESALSRGYLAADHYYTLAGMESPIHLLDREERDRVYAHYQQVLLEEAGFANAADLAGEVYRQYWKIDRKFALFDDVVPTLSQLTAEGYRLGLISNITDDPSGDLEKVGLSGRFDTIIASCNVGYEKPDPRIFKAALDALEVRPEQAVHVGDQFLADIVGAGRAGLKAVLVDRHNLQEGRHPLRIRSLLELPALLRIGSA